MPKKLKLEDLGFYIELDMLDTAVPIEPIPTILPFGEDGKNLKRLRARLEAWEKMKEVLGEDEKLLSVVLGQFEMKEVITPVPGVDVPDRPIIVKIPRSGLADFHSAPEMVIRPAATGESSTPRFWFEDTAERRYSSTSMSEADVLVAELVVAKEADVDRIFSRIIDIAPKVALKTLENGIHVQPGWKRDIAPHVRKETMAPLLSNSSRDMRLAGAKALRNRR